VTLDLLARLVVLLACAVAVGALYVQLARPRSDRAAPGPGGAGPRPLPGAVDAALGAFVVVAGGAALTGIGLAGAEAAGLALVRLAGIALLAAAGGLAVVALRGRGRRRGRGPLGPPAIVGMAWLGAGLALAAPLVLLVAAVVIVLLAVRVTARPAA
jgi:hypothetical protein